MMTNQISQDDATVVEGQTDFAAELAALKETVAVLETELETARTAEQPAASEALELRTRLDAAQAHGRDAAIITAKRDWRPCPRCRPCSCRNRTTSRRSIAAWTPLYVWCRRFASRLGRRRRRRFS